MPPPAAPSAMGEMVQPLMTPVIGARKQNFPSFEQVEPAEKVGAQSPETLAAGRLIVADFSISMRSHWDRCLTFTRRINGSSDSQISFSSASISICTRHLLIKPR